MSVTTAVRSDGLNIVILVGEITTPLVTRSLSNGDVVSSFDIATTTEDGRLAVPVSIPGDPDIGAVGSPVCVVGAVRRRFFRSGGTVTSRTEVVAHSVISMRRRAHIRKALERPVAYLIDLQSV